MNNILFKNTMLTLTLGLLSNTSIATNDAYDNEYSKSIRSATVKQVSPQNGEDKIEELQKMVFSGEQLLNIALYLGRQEAGRMQQVNKSLNRFFIQDKESSQIWKSYAHQLQLKIADDIKVETLISQIKDYFRPKIHSLFDLNYMHHSRFIYIDITCFNSNKCMVAGCSYNGENGNIGRTAITWIDGKIQPLDLLKDGYSSMATAMSLDGRVVAGWVYGTQNGNMGRIASAWVDGRIQPLGRLNEGYSSIAKAISADGRVIAGWESDARDLNTGRKAVIWIDGSIEYLKLLNEEYSSSVAKAISADGRVVAGWACDDQNGNMGRKAVIWIDSNMQYLTLLNKGYNSVAKAVSADGRVIAGWACDDQNGNMGRKAVIWTDGSMEYLKLLNRGCSSRSKCVSADGGVIAGWAWNGQNGNKKTAVLWNWQGILSLDSYPFEQSHDYLHTVMAVSDNGSDFITQSRKSKIYKAHIPRYDLWKMK